MTSDGVRAANAMQEPPTHNLTGLAADIYEAGKRRVAEWDPFRNVRVRTAKEGRGER